MKSGAKYFLFMGLFFCAFPFVSQQLSHGDSLAMKIKEAKHDSSRLEGILSYALFLEKTDIDSAIALLETGLKISEKAHDTIRLMRVHLAIGNALSDESKYEKVISHAKELIRLGMLSRRKKFAARGYNLVGNTYQQLGQYDKALTNLLMALKLREETGNLSMIANSYANIGNFHLRQKEFPEAIAYLEKAIATQTKEKELHALGASYTSMGIAYIGLKDYGKAEEFLLMAAETAQKNGDELLRAHSFVNLGTVYKNTGKRKEALAIYSKALAVFEKIKFTAGVAAASGDLGNLFALEGNTTRGIEYLNRAVALCRETGNREYEALFYKDLAGLYKKLNNFEKAFEMFDAGVKLNDSIQNEETKKSLTKKELQYQFEKKSAADSVQNAEKQKVKDAQLNAQAAKLKQEKTQFWFLVCGLSFVVCGLLFVVNRFRITEKQKKIIEEQKLLVDEAFEKLHEKNKEVLDSIRYAKRIQTALLPSDKYVERILSFLNKNNQ
jgi:tetratricopeptide (TPR) repeat protein